MIKRLNKTQQREIKKLVSKLHNKERVDMIQVIKAIVFLLHTGCQWYRLPSQFPKYGTVYYHFRHLSDSNMLPVILARIIRTHRQHKGKAPCPTIAVIDSQSVRSGHSQSQKGIDGYKKIKGIKRQIAVDEDGLPLCIDVTTANVHDSRGVYNLLKELKLRYPHIALIKADKGYNGVQPLTGLEIKCVKSNYGSSDFIPLQGRWVVERTIAWIDNYRRLVRNYERYLTTARAMVYLASIALVLRL